MGHEQQPTFYSGFQASSWIGVITPEVAEQMLLSSAGNRNIRWKHVYALGGAMLRGEWLVTNQGIGFDADGRLRDGHHRLHACVKAGVPFQTMIVAGMNDGAYQVIDSGAPRTFADRAGINKREAEVYSLAGQLLYSTKPTVNQMRPFQNGRLGHAARELLDFAPSVRAVYTSAPMKLGACVMMIDDHGDRDFVLRQYRALSICDLESLSMSGRGMIRHVSTNRVNSNDKSGMIARAMSVFDVAKKDNTKLQITENVAEQMMAKLKRTLTQNGAQP